MHSPVPPLLVGLISCALIWGVARYAPGPVFFKLGALPFIAGFFFLTGLGLGLACVVKFRGSDTTVNPLKPENASTLVTSGPYRFSRNPMYLSMLLVLTGWAVFLGHGLGIIPLIGFVAYITQYQIKPEETAMILNFGQTYKDYMRNTRRWL